MRFNCLIVLILLSCKDTTSPDIEWPNILIKAFEAREMEKQNASYIIQSNLQSPSIMLQWEKIESNEAVDITVYRVENGNITDTLKTIDDINKTETIIEDSLAYEEKINLAIKIRNSDGEESPLNKSNVISFTITKPVINNIDESLILEVSNTSIESLINYESLRDNLVDSVSVSFEFRESSSTNVLDFRKIITFIGPLKDNNIAKDIAVNGSYGVDNRRLEINIDSLVSKLSQNKISIVSDYDRAFFVDNNYSLLKSKAGRYRIYMYLYKSSAIYRSDYLKEYIVL